MPLSPFYGNVDVVGAYDKATGINRDADAQKLKQFLTLKQIIEEQQFRQQQLEAQMADRAAARDAEAARGQPIGAGGLRLQGGEIIPPSVKPAAPAESPLAKLRREKAALPPGDPGHKEYADAILKESQTAKQITPTVIQQAPVTPVTVADPANPNETIIIDGRTKNVLGKGPKLTQVGGQERQLELDLPKAKERVDIMVQNLDRMESAIGELAQDPGLSRITGTFMGRTPNISNKATTAQAKLDSITSQIFVSALQSMRESSKTGGAVGNVSDREGDKLQRTIAALDQAQGTASFKTELDKAIVQLRTSKAIIKRAFEDQFRGVQPRNAPPAADDPLGLRK